MLGQRGRKGWGEARASLHSHFVLHVRSGGITPTSGQTEMLALCPRTHGCCQGLGLSPQFSRNDAAWPSRPGQAGLGSGGGSFDSAGAVHEAVYLTWPEPECWPCKHSLSYDTNTTCSQKKYLKNANWQKNFLNDGKRKCMQPEWGWGREGQGSK